jgi:hypothetical protein
VIEKRTRQVFRWESQFFWSRGGVGPARDSSEFRIIQARVQFPSISWPEKTKTSMICLMVRKFVRITCLICFWSSQTQRADALNDFDKLEVSHSAVNTDATDSKQSLSSQKIQGSASASSGAANAPFSNLFDAVPSSAPGEKTEAEMTMQFASTMRDLLKDVSSDPEILKLLDEMVPDGNKAAGSGASSSSTGAAASSSSTGSAPSPPLGEDELQKKINEALEALNQHADNAVRRAIDFS